MNKTLLFISLFCVSLHFSVKAQESIIQQINYPLLEKYIELAKQNYPRKKIYEANVVAAKSKIGAASLGYLEALTASYYYRPNERQSIDITNPYSVNGFQFGVNLNVGQFFKTPSLVKQSKQDYKVSVLEDQEYNITLATEVKKRYYEYVQLINELKIKTQLLTDNKASSDNLKYKFEKGEATLDLYSQAKSSTSIANSEKILAELNLLKAKDALEELIGQKLEDVK